MLCWIIEILLILIIWNLLFFYLFFLFLAKQTFQTACVFVCNFINFAYVYAGFWWLANKIKKKPLVCVFIDWLIDFRFFSINKKIFFLIMVAATVAVVVVVRLKNLNVKKNWHHKLIIYFAVRLFVYWTNRSNRFWCQKWRTDIYMAMAKMFPGVDCRRKIDCFFLFRYR